MNPMPCLFVGAPWGEVLALIELPIREIESLHGLDFYRVKSRLREDMYGGHPVYEFTGRRTQYAPPKRTFKSRAEMTGKKPTRAVDVD